MFTTQQLQQYKKALETEREKLLEEIKRNKAQLDFGSDVDSLDEEADEAEELGNELGVEAVFRGRINEIDSALDRIRAGTYGACAACGAVISEKVLDAAPESRLCERCKKKA